MNNHKESIKDMKIKHLEMIEAVIERMAQNSFHLKGWTVTLVSVISAILISGNDRRFMILLLLPLLSFWILDAHYLQLERKYQILYRNVIDDELDADYSMDIRKIIISEEDKPRISTLGCMFSKTERCFYGFILAAVIAIVIMWRR